MNATQSYRMNSALGGWTRVDLLIAIYDRAISSLERAQSAAKEGHETEFARNYLAAQKAILAIHSGLKPDEYEIAFNYARLLHFVLACIEKNNFLDALKILTELRSGILAIQEEANQLEQNGGIDRLVESDEYAMHA